MAQFRPDIKELYKEDQLILKAVFKVLCQQFKQILIQ